ncbi:MAG TPA: Gfo/Idh/MocA family oxidoreductase [Candidatus Lokiarchaeia archaeon]|nr:Gfo/Idh/MocA family oxidoreductase [Candidatus Lokiarchaeia archaeon]
MSKKTIVLIGYGNIGHEWEKSIRQHPDWELIGIVDTNTELLQHIPTMNLGLGDDQVFTSIEAAVQYGQKPDLAIVAVPIYYHHIITKNVMDLDINVICEKNMAATIHGGRQMVQCAKDKPNLCTGIDTQYRYLPNYFTVHQFFKQEKVPIGKLGMIKWDSTDFRGEVNKPWWWAQSDIYLEDMSIHWFDLIRFTTGLDIVQVKADVFMPRYSEWSGSSEIHANLALARPEDYDNRHEWVWCQFHGGFQRGGSTYNDFIYFGKEGQAKITDFGIELKIYKDKIDTTKFEEDGYLIADAGPVAGTPYTGHMVQLDLMSKSIDSGGKMQPPTNFCEAFKSFAVTMACLESSRSNKTVWVPDYWKGLLD